ncbi:MAG TPA: TIR domain-containing protein, partial [Opitutaceae bacterium]|nr:TIR domain-containing protein [Opitutaceae bacterium]
RFAKEVGFTHIEFKRRYDFALSFAGHDRPIARLIFDELSDEEFEVFYDFNESSRIMAEDVEDYLGPIYHTEASFILVLLSPYYPQRVWTKFESEAFKDRIKDGAVIPIWLSEPNTLPSSETMRIGSMRLQRKRDMTPQIKELCRSLGRKILTVRHNGD